MPLRSWLLLASLALCAAPATAAVHPYPASFRITDMAVGDARIHVRDGGTGPVVVLLHGFGDTGDMWEPLARRLAANHRVIVPDLRGMGLSSHPAGGYTKKAQAEDLTRILDRLGVHDFQLVTHDIGNMVGYALIAENRARVRTWVVMDAPLPGIGHWDDQLRNPKTWHFNFRGPDVERLVAGRERILLDRFYNDLSADRGIRIDEATRNHYAALYARPQAIHDAFEQFAAFPQDGIDNQAFLAAGKLTLPVLAIGGAASYGANLAPEIRFVAEDVTPLTIPNAGHWLMEEQTDATTAAILGFLGRH